MQGKTKSENEVSNVSGGYCEDGMRAKDAGALVSVPITLPPVRTVLLR